MSCEKIFQFHHKIGSYSYSIEIQDREVIDHKNRYMVTERVDGVVTHRSYLADMGEALKNVQASIETWRES